MARKYAYTKEQILEFQKKYKTDTNIAAHLGITRQGVQHHRKQYGIPFFDRFAKRNVKILAMHEQGMNYEAIARKMKLSCGPVVKEIIKRVKAKKIMSMRGTSD